MLRFKRPKRPKGFAKEVGPTVHAVERAVAAGQQPEFPELWVKFKAAFSEAQRCKCGYCETFTLNHPAAMEHFAPKGRVEALVNEGVEAGSLYNVTGRETPSISSTGYYWLAYAWDNWLLACERCNTGWKRSLFPVREDPHPSPPSPVRPITPLLVNPFGPEDPVEHLDFTVIGEIFARDGSAVGDATIRTCGLHRESLRRARAGIADDTRRYIGRLQKALAAGGLEAARSATDDLLALGGETRAHAGMVRSIVLSKLALRWDELVALRRRLEAASPSKPPGRRSLARKSR